MTADELNIKITADTSDVSGKMKQAAKDVENLGEAAKKSAGSEKESAEAMNSMSTAAQAVAQAASQLVLSFNNLGTTVSGVSSGFGAIAMATSQLSAAIPTATSGLSAVGSAAAEAEDEIKDAGDELEDLGEAASKATPKIEDVGEETKKAGEEARGAKTKFKDFGDTANNISFAKLKNGLVSLGLGKILKTSVTNAMNAIESENLFETSLGSYANEAREWSNELSEKLGLDPYVLRNNVGTFYNMMTSMRLSRDASYELSTGLTQLGEDMASFYNISSEEAFYKLRSGITGETEPLKQLGILLDEQTIKEVAWINGIAETGTELTNQQKVLARYQAILEQTGNAQGDLARTINDPSNQLRATMSDLQSASVELGLALMPIVQTALPIFRQVISDMSPVVSATVQGISTIGTALQILENPAARGIAYAGLAVVAMNKLKAAVGGTAAGLMLLGGILSFVLGKYAQSQEEADKTLSTGMDGASNAADKAAISTDGLTDSLNEANAAAAKLAGFDEITKLSGGGSGSTIASKIATAEDIANIDSVSSAIDTYNDAIADIDDNPFGSLSNIDWTKLKNDLKALGDDISLVFKGTETESFQALQRLRDRVKILFGEEFTAYWEGVGADIYKVFNGTETESFQALQRLNERIKEIPFGETLSESFKSFGGNLSKMVEGFKLLTEGDWDGAMAKFSEMALANKKASAERLGVEDPADYFNSEVFLEAAAGYFNARTEGNYGSAMRYRDRIEKQIYDALKPKSDNDTPTSSSGIRFPDVVYETPTLPQISYGNNGMSRNFNTGALNDPPMTAEDMMNIWLSRGGGNSNVSGPIQINTTIELDGETLGEKTINYQNNQIEVTNGR